MTHPPVEIDTSKSRSTFWRLVALECQRQYQVEVKGDEIPAELVFAWKRSSKPNVSLQVLHQNLGSPVDCPSLNTASPEYQLLQLV